MEGELDFENTGQIPIPKTLAEQIIGQDEAVRIAKIAAKQRRHLLLVGPPGTGKSMIARAMATMLPNAKEEISVIHNPLKPERPLLEIRGREEATKKQAPAKKQAGTLLAPKEVPDFVAIRLGYLCKGCKAFSSPKMSTCPACNKEKYRKFASPFDDLLDGLGESEMEDIVHTTRIMEGKEELVIFERADDNFVRALEQKDISGTEKEQSTFPRNVIVPLERALFVQATGASETELLGDVRHDPYGGHHQIGTPAYTRVVPGAVHEAHEGILFIDELVSLGKLQRNILTAMQDRKFPISGRNASSTGSSVRVDSVPCEFILVSAVNINDLPELLAPLRSRICGNGYEVLVNSVMDDSGENRKKFAQFVAQEIRRDGRIVHANKDAVLSLLDEAKKRARIIDKKQGISLRLRAISGIIKAAGDFAFDEGSFLIEPKHVKLALARGLSAEEQINSRYGSIFKGAMSDFATSLPSPSDNDVG